MSRQTRRVVCTGIGIVSPLGVGSAINWSALMGSRCGITQIKREHSFPGNKSRVAAYVPDKQLEDALDSNKHTYISKNSKQLSRACKLAMLAAQEALEESELIDSYNDMPDKYRERTGVAIGQGMVDFEDIFQNGSYVFGREPLEDDPVEGLSRKISPFFMTRALINMAAGNVSIRYKTQGPNHCVSTACATGAHSIGDAYNFIKNGHADIMICGGTEAAINSLSIAGFGRLRALATKYNDYPELSSRPFDKKRNGFVMGEGSGVMILEALDHVKARQFDSAKIQGEILGYGISSDGHHLTAPLPNGGGAERCMKQAINNAKLKPSDITHINSHATSTPMGDDIEAIAIERVFYDEQHKCEIPVTSCKGSIGHLLGAAGSVESIFALMSCKTSVIPPCLNLVDPLETDKNLVKFITDKPATWDLDHRILLKNSFGFGGTNACLVMSNYVE